MQGLFSESYMPLGDLIIKQSFTNKTTANYYRDLNIQDGIATTKFSIDNVDYKRQVFASAPDNIIIIKCFKIGSNIVPDGQHVNLLS